MTIDFTYQHWGHALHGHTWSIVLKLPRMKMSQRIRKWLGFRFTPPNPLYTVCCHHCDEPQIGDVIRYRSQRGISHAEVIKVHAFWDPRDMYELTVRILLPTEKVCSTEACSAVSVELSKQSQ